LSFGKKIFFSGELLRSLVNVYNDFLKFLIFKVLKKLLKNITSLRACSGLYAYAEHAHQFLTRMLSISVKISNLQGVPANHAEHTHKELERMLSIRVRS
jgi:hypothetical protein